MCDSIVPREVYCCFYNHTEFYNILNDEYQNYKIVDAIESQKFDYPRSDSESHGFVSVGTNGVGFGIIT